MGTRTLKPFATSGRVHLIRTRESSIALEEVLLEPSQLNHLQSETFQITIGIEGKTTAERTLGLK